MIKRHISAETDVHDSSTCPMHNLETNAVKNQCKPRLLAGAWWTSFWVSPGNKKFVLGDTLRVLKNALPEGEWDNQVGKLFSSVLCGTSFAMHLKRHRVTNLLSWSKEQLEMQPRCCAFLERQSTRHISLAQIQTPLPR